MAWVTLDVVPNSRGIPEEEKETLLASKGYRAPMPNEAVTSNLILNLEPSKETQGYFFGETKEGFWTYAATTEIYNTCRLIVGAAAPSGPKVDCAYGDNYTVGVAGVAEVP